MNRAYRYGWVVGLLTIFALASTGISQEPPPQGEAVPPNAIEVLTRGPVHEAFAQPMEVQPDPGLLVPKGPPPMIPEDPPEQKPDIDGVQWIPGYWAWDAQRQEFMWVSGTYRVPPPGRTYVPGYWSNTPQGWRWIAGFWANANQQEIPYTPEPPAPLDNGPTVQAPDDNSMYVPGTWIWQQDRFAWRPGYWAPFRENRVWNPPHYVWTPSGYLFVDGYWDFPLDNRGLLFAPVFFNQPLWRTAGWRYRPGFVVGCNGLFDSAFVCGPSFYFGNFYDPFYARHGFRPWYAGRGRYDPIFAHHGWRNHHGNPNWIAGVQKTYAGRHAGQIAAPPLSLAQQNNTGRVVTPIHQFNNTNFRMVNTTATHVQVQRTLAQQTHQLAVNRQQADAARLSSKQSIGNGSLRIANNTKSTNGVRSSNYAPNSRPTVSGPANTGPKIINQAPRVTTPARPVVTPQKTAPRIATPPTTIQRSFSPQVAPKAPTTVRSATVPKTPTPVYRSTPAARVAAPARVSAPARTINRAPARVGGGVSRSTGGRRR